MALFETHGVPKCQFSEQNQNSFSSIHLLPWFIDGLIEKIELVEVETTEFQSRTNDSQKHFLTSFVFEDFFAKNPEI